MRFRDLFQGRPPADWNAFHPYSEKLVELLETQNMISPGMSGVDICTEGGKLAGLFLHRGYSITLIEANPEKHDGLRHLAHAGSAFRLISGDPLKNNLPAEQFDFVVSERALYFQKRQELRSEFQRLLRPGGHVILISDKRVYSGGLQSEAFDHLLRTHCKDFRERVAPFDIRAAVQNFFQSDPYEDALMGEQPVTREEFLEQSRCLPIYPAPQDPGYTDLERALHSFFTQWSSQGVLHIPFICRIAAGPINSSR